MSARAGTTLAAFVAVILAPLVARASPTTAQCIEANEHALAERKSLSYRDAQRDFLVCADASCPAEIAGECTRQLHDVVAAMPSIVFAVKSDKGDDLTDVRVEMDGRVIAERLGATAIVVDPGEHTFVVTGPGRGSVTRKLLLREGEKERAETFMLPSPAPLRAPPPPTTHEMKHSSGWRAAGIALASGGLVGVVLGSIFGAVAISAYDEQKRQCPNGSCADVTKHDAAKIAHDRADWSSTASTIGFIAGGVFLVAGGVVFFAAPSVRTDRVGLAIGGTF